MSPQITESSRDPPYRVCQAPLPKSDFDLTRNYLNSTIPPQWGSLQQTVIQGSGFDGPIPLEIASLTKMTDLRISDLNGIEATFPPLNNMKNMKTLLLRNCNITGPLPEYLANFTNLQTLDLSFKKLNGEIPSNFENLSTVEFMYGYRNLFASSSNDNLSQVSKPLAGLYSLSNMEVAGHIVALIMFTDDKTYSNLGRRIFDIYIQYHVSKNENNISMGVVVRIVAAVAFVIILLLGILWWRGYLLRKDTMEHDGLDLKIGSLTLRQLKAATNNFDVANKIGESGFGSAYKGFLLDETIISLEECQLKLHWATRYKICIGIARGLAYLHEESRLKIVHRDINATNVLHDKNLNPKISDFGLAKLDEEDNTHISTRIVRTYGYMEIISGRNNTSSRRNEDSLYLLDWALELKEKGKLMELVDPKLGLDFIEKEVIVMINITILCTNVTPTIRPTMSSVVSMLEGRAVVEELVPDSTIFNHKMAVKGMMVNLQHRHEIDMNDSFLKCR
ncbi:unnamed protein product [Camellia sinensis]